MLVMTERAPEQVPDKKLPFHYVNLMLWHSRNCWVFVTPCAGEPSTHADVRRWTLMFAVATEAFEVMGGVHRQRVPRHKPGVFVGDVEPRMGIVFAQLTVAIYTARIRRPAPWTVTGVAVGNQLLVRFQ